MPVWHHARNTASAIANRDAGRKIVRNLMDPRVATFVNIDQLDFRLVVTMISSDLSMN